MNQVSVVIPTYLEEKYIEKCLNSIKKQDFNGKIETIVCDSNSSDRTRELAKKYADKVINIEKRGIARGRNAGLKASTGDIVIFVDADIRLHQSFIRKVLEEFKNENIVGVFPKILTYDGYFLGNITHHIGCHLVRISSFLRIPMFPLCAAYRRSALNRVSGFNEKVIVGEDLDLSLRISKLGKCVCTKKGIAFTSLRRFRKSGLLSSVFFQLSCYFRLILFRKLPTVTIYFHTEEDF